MYKNEGAEIKGGAIIIKDIHSEASSSSKSNKASETDGIIWEAGQTSVLCPKENVGFRTAALSVTHIILRINLLEAKGLEKCFENIFCLHFYSRS